MNPLSFLRRFRARAQFNEAQDSANEAKNRHADALARFAKAKPELERAKRMHRPTRHLLRTLRMAQCDMLRAEIEMGRR